MIYKIGKTDTCLVLLRKHDILEENYCFRRIKNTVTFLMPLVGILFNFYNSHITQRPTKWTISYKLLCN